MNTITLPELPSALSLADASGRLQQVAVFAAAATALPDLPSQLSLADASGRTTEVMIFAAHS